MDIGLLRTTVENALQGTDLFLVGIEVKPGNEIIVEIDSPTNVDIAQCADITRKIETVFDRDVEDYSLEVGSAGFTAPFKVIQQYQKNLGNEVEVLTKDGKKLVGTLTSVVPEDNTFTIEIPTKVKEPGAKRPTIQMVPQTLNINDCKQVKYHFVFK